MKIVIYVSYWVLSLSFLCGVLSKELEGYHLALCSLVATVDHAGLRIKAWTSCLQTICSKPLNYLPGTKELLQMKIINKGKFSYYQSFLRT